MCMLQVDLHLKFLINIKLFKRVTELKFNVLLQVGDKQEFSPVTCISFHLGIIIFLNVSAFKFIT